MDDEFSDPDFSSFVPPHQREWRHPSELGSRLTFSVLPPPKRRPLGLMILCAVIGALAMLAFTSLMPTGIDTKVVPQSINPIGAVVTPRPPSSPAIWFTDLKLEVRPDDGTTAAIARDSVTRVMVLASSNENAQNQVHRNRGAVMLAGEDGLASAILGTNTGRVGQTAGLLVVTTEHPMNSPAIITAEDSTAIIGMLTELDDDARDLQHYGISVIQARMIAQRVAERRSLERIEINCTFSDSPQPIASEPCHESGLRPGDIIESANGEPTPSSAALAASINWAFADQPLKLGIRRGTQQLTVELQDHR